MPLAEAVDNPTHPLLVSTKDEGERTNRNRREPLACFSSSFVLRPWYFTEEDCLSLWLACPERGGRCATRTPRSPRPSRRHLAGMMKPAGQRMNRTRSTGPLARRAPIHPSSFILHPPEEGNN